MSLTQRAASGFRAMLVARGIQITAKGLLVLLLTRVFLDPEQYGVVFLAISILTFLLLFSNLGFAKSAARYIAEYRESDPSQVPVILTTALRYTLVSILTVCAFLALANGYIADVLDEPRLAPLLLVGAGYIATSTLFTYLQLTFQGFNRVTWTAIVASISSAGTFVAVVAFLVLDFGIHGVLYGYVAGGAIAAVVGFTVMYRRFYTQYERGDPEPGLRRRILRYSVPLTATRGANKIDNQVDTILVGYFINPVAVGFYTLGKQIADFVIAPASSLGFSVSPSFGEKKAEGAIDEAAAIYEQTFTFVVLLYVPAAVGLALVADPAVPLIFGAEYAGAVPVIQVFGIFVFLRAIDKVTSDGLDYLGRANARAVAKGVTAIANVLLNLVMIPTLGVVGAAIATVITYSVLVGVELYVIYAEIGVSLRTLFGRVVHVSAISIGMAAVVLALMPHVTSVTSLVAVVAIGVAVWALLVELGGPLDLLDVVSLLS